MDSGSRRCQHTSSSATTAPSERRYSTRSLPQIVRGARSCLISCPQAATYHAFIGNDLVPVIHPLFRHRSCPLLRTRSAGGQEHPQMYATINSAYSYDTEMQVRTGGPAMKSYPIRPCANCGHRRTVETRK